VNTAATAELLEWAGRTGIRRFVLASTGGVFAPQAGPVSEETPSTARGLYPLSKRLAEQLVGAYAEHFETVILRFFFPYGPGQRDRLIPDLASSIAAGRPITLRTEGGLRLNPIFASDTVRAIVAALEGGGTPLIHVAGPEIISLRQLAHRIGEIVGRPATFVVDAAAGPQDLIAATDVMRRCLVSPEIGLAEGLRRALSPAGRGA
jgi:nucleoside-diphosphate-sugar epimerase